MLWRILRNNRGQAMTEAALITPLLVFLLFATMIFGMMINARIVITSAAREGARQMALFNNQAAARERVADSMAILPSQFNQVILFDPATDVIITDRGPDVEVLVRYRQPTVVPLLPVILSPETSPWSTFALLEGLAVHRKEFEH